jgi:hypothetical protein
LLSGLGSGRSWGCDSRHPWTDPFEIRRHVVKVTGLPDPDEYDCNEMYGLMCEVREGRRKWQVPLGYIEVGRGSRVAVMLTDYGYWFCNR